MEDKQYQKFRFLVKLYAQLYTSVELMDEAQAKPFIKNVTRLSSISFIDFSKYSTA